MTAAVMHQIYCRFCIAHCGLIVEVEDGVAIGVRGDPSHPLSQGYTCAKGRSSVKAHYDQHRLDHPLRRRDDDGQEEVGWSSSLDEIAHGVDEIIRREGPDAVGLFIGTGGSHDAAGRRLGVKWLRALGSRSQYSVATIDAPGKPLVAELVTGSPALFSPVIDVENTRLTLLIGSNPLISHGHTSGWPNPRIRLRKLMSDGEVWVVDPRRTETAMVATRHLAPRVGTDHIWLAAIANELLSTTDRADLESRATGVSALEQALTGFTLERAADESGLNPEDLKRLLALIREGGPVAIQSGTGVSMSAAAPVTEWLIWVIQILTDSLDQEGGSWFNRGFLRSLDKVATTIGDGAGQLGPASRPELRARLGEFPAVALADEILSGNLKALVVFGANLITALPDSERTREALSSLELLVVLDVMENDTTRMATHVLPCAGVLERADLPFITDMYIPAVATQYAGAVLPLTASRRPAWRVFAELGSRLGMDLLDGLGADVATDDDLLRPMTSRAHAPLEDLMARPGCHLVESPRVGWVRNSVLPDGKWRIAPMVLADRLREISREPRPRGLVLLPRRQLRQLNSQLTESGTKDRRFARPLILVNPDDATELGLHDGSRVRVASLHGSVTGDLVFDTAVARGGVSIPHGHAAVNVNHLTSTVHDIEPLTGMVLSSGFHVELAAIS